MLNYRPVRSELTDCLAVLQAKLAEDLRKAQEAEAAKLAALAEKRKCVMCHPPMHLCRRCAAIHRPIETSATALLRHPLTACMTDHS